MWKMSIQYMVLGLEPMTFRTWVSSHNHYTRAPAYTYRFFTNPVFTNWQNWMQNVLHFTVSCRKDENKSKNDTFTKIQFVAKRCIKIPTDVWKLRYKGSNVGTSIRYVQFAKKIGRAFNIWRICWFIFTFWSANCFLKLSEQKCFEIILTRFEIGSKLNF